MKHQNLIHPLLALSPVDGRYASVVNILRGYGSEFSLIRARVRVELVWLMALARARDVPECPPCSREKQNTLHMLWKKFSLDDALRVKALEQVTHHDVKAVEYWIREQLVDLDGFEEYIPWVHFACTSEDVNSVAYALMLRDLRDEVIAPICQSCHDVLADFAHRWADRVMVARTHGQTASPTTMGKECANIAHRLARQIEQFRAVHILAKMNGAVGNFNAHLVAYPKLDWLTFVRDVIEGDLGLNMQAYTTQIEPHDGIAEYAAVLERVNTIVIDLARDFWGYISLGYFKQQVNDEEVGSSTMPHKVNPIDFENAEGNAGLSNALFAHIIQKLPISRWQRDLSDSTVLRNVALACTYHYLALTAILRGLSKLELDQDAMLNDLVGQWSLLGEAVQTAMRKACMGDAYEQLKELTRGKTLSQEDLHVFIESLPLDEEIRHRLRTLTPESYVGLASVLAGQYDNSSPEWV